MPRPLLPPRGIYVPSRIVYTRELSPSVIHTWVQLRGLAWGKDETPPISIFQLSELTGKSRSTIFGHMALLRQWGALRWRSSDDGTLIVTFPTNSSEFFQDSDPESCPVPEYLSGCEGEIRNPESKILEKPDPSLNPPVNHIDDQSVNYQQQRFEEIISPEDNGEGNWEREINQLASSRGSEVQKSGLKSRNSDTFQEFGLPPKLDGADPAKVYQKVTGIRPNQYQRG